MPTTYQANSFSDVPVHEHNRVIARISRNVLNFTLTTSGDKVQFHRLPSKGFKLTNVGIISGILDSDGTSKTLTLDVVLTKNDGGTEYTLISASTIGRAGGTTTAWVANSAGWLTYLKAGALKGEGWVVEIRVNAAPATAAAASLQCYLEYTCDTEGGELKRRS
jgi:hypothetical protein